MNILAPIDMEVDDTSPLDRKLKATGFYSAQASQKKPIEFSLRQFSKKVTATEGLVKANLPWIKLARYGDKQTAKGSYRHDGNVEFIDGIEGDYDGEKIQMGVAAELLRSACIAALFYESPSSSPSKPRWRVLCPCSKSLSPIERVIFAGRVNGVLGGILARESFTLSQAYYFGNVKGTPKRKVILVDGRFIDTANELADLRGIPSENHQSAQVSEISKKDGSRSQVEIDHATHLHLTGGTIEELKTWLTYNDNPSDDYQRDPVRRCQKLWKDGKAFAEKIAKRNGTLDFEVLRPDGLPGVKSAGSLNIVCVADLEPENIIWVWKQRLAKGKITILAGDPGQGKSQTSLNITATISKGGKWPDGGNAPNGSIVILSAEDGAADTTAPRLIAARADTSKVHIVRSVADKGQSRSFDLRQDLQKLDEVCDQLGDVVLVIIDPITSYLGTIDSHRTGDVRAVLEPLGTWAERRGVAILAISHPPKAAQSKAINAVTGSLAFVAAARVVLVAVADPEAQGRSLLLPVKINIGLSPKGLGYRIVGRIVDGPKGPIETSAIEWDDKEVRLTANQALAATREGQGGPNKAMGDAVSFLRGKLGFGDVVAATKLIEEAEALCISGATLRRARKQLGVVVEKNGFQGAWLWRLQVVDPNEEEQRLGRRRQRSKL